MEKQNEKYKKREWNHPSTVIEHPMNRGFDPQVIWFSWKVLVLNTKLQSNIENFDCVSYLL